MENEFLILKITFLILENQRFSNIYKGIFNIRKSFSNINKGVATYFLILIKRALRTVVASQNWAHLMMS